MLMKICKLEGLCKTGCQTWYSGELFSIFVKALVYTPSHYYLAIKVQRKMQRLIFCYQYLNPKARALGHLQFVPLEFTTLARLVLSITSHAQWIIYIFTSNLQCPTFTFRRLKNDLFFTFELLPIDYIRQIRTRTRDR